MSLAIYQQAQQRLKPELILTNEQSGPRACIIDCIKSFASGAEFQQQFAGAHREAAKSCAIH
ncbi:MAG: hypothetical protein ACJA13_004029 [Paraglaciecola sp.]|jgi:hypothetical protein